MSNAEAGEKVYFQRIEIVDGATCPFCKKMNGVIAVWSETPLSNDKVDGDPYATVALWEGKDWNGQKNYVANGAFHSIVGESGLGGIHALTHIPQCLKSEVRITTRQ